MSAGICSDGVNPLILESLISNWMPATQLAQILEIGDRVEFRRDVKNGHSIYSHWGIYVTREGDEPCICHLSDSSDDFGSISASPLSISSSSRNAKVQIQKLSEVARGDLCRINNRMDMMQKPLPTGKIILRAVSKVGLGGYNILFNNCEHFVNDCRYAVKLSTQVLRTAEVVATPVLGIIACSTLGAAVAAAASFISKFT